MNLLNNIPQVTRNLFIINLLMFFFTWVLETKGIDLIAMLGSHYINSPDFSPYQIVTHMFMHQGFWHIFMNMWLFLMLGGNLESLWGPKRFFIFYLACGLGAFVLHNAIGVYQIYELRQQLSASLPMDTIDQIIKNNPDGVTAEAINNYLKTKNLFSGNDLQSYYNLTHSTMLGASGAVFGVLAAFAVLFPNQVFLLYFAIPVKAKYLVGAYIFFELYMAYKNGSDDNVAHLAHIGGAIVGVAMVLYWRKFDKSNFY